MRRNNTSKGVYRQAHFWLRQRSQMAFQYTPLLVLVSEGGECVRRRSSDTFHYRLNGWKEGEGKDE